MWGDFLPFRRSVIPPFRVLGSPILSYLTFRDVRVVLGFRWGEGGEGCLVVVGSLLLFFLNGVLASFITHNMYTSSYSYFLLFVIFVIIVSTHLK